MSYYEVDAWDLLPFDEKFGRVEYLWAFNRRGEADLFVRKGLKVTECEIEKDLIDANKEYARRTERDPDKFTFLYVNKESNPNGQETGCQGNVTGGACCYRASHFDCGDSLKPLDPPTRSAVYQIVCRLLAFLHRLR